MPSNSIVIHGDSSSGNCHKVKFTCDYLSIPYEWKEYAVLKGETRTPEFLAINPFGQVPAIQLPDGRCLAQSNAIINFLAEGTTLIPKDRFMRAKMFEWLFWEQYSHEPAVAVLRYKRYYLKLSAAEVDPTLIDKSEKALNYLEKALDGQVFLLGQDFSLADIALLAYTRLFADAGLTLDSRPRLRGWIQSCEQELGLSPVSQG